MKILIVNCLRSYLNTWKSHFIKQFQDLWLHIHTSSQLKYFCVLWQAVVSFKLYSKMAGNMPKYALILDLFTRQ